MKLAAHGEADLQAGRTAPQSEVFQGLRDRLTVIVRTQHGLSVTAVIGGVFISPTPCRG